MAWIRHRARNIRESVWDDLKAALTQTNWVGATPLAMLNHPIVFTDAFPEEAEVQGEPIKANTFVMDEGVPEDPRYLEMGSNFQSQAWVFTIGFYAESDAVALALLQDLSDLYYGKFFDLPTHESIALYNFNAATPTHVVDMEVEVFRFNRSPDQEIGFGYELYLAELIVTDYIDPT